MVAVRYVVQDLGACELLLCLHAGVNGGLCKYKSICYIGIFVLNNI